MQVKKTALADEDLINIFIYGSQSFGQLQAELYFEEINRTFFSAENPSVCPERNEFCPPVRVHSHPKHLIIYTVEKDVILIVRVRHYRMNLLQQLEDLELN